LLHRLWLPVLGVSVSALSMKCEGVVCVCAHVYEVE